MSERDSLPELVQETLDRAAALSHLAWDTLVPASLEQLHELPAHLHATFADLVDKLTLRQGVPDPRDWLPDSVLPAAAAPAPPPPPPPALYRSYAGALARHAQAHPWTYTVATLGLSAGTAYALYPAETTRALAPLAARLVPLALLPDPTHRPLRLLPAEHGVAHEIRKEAVVVLGADSPAGREIALDLERRGFVVVATVADPHEVDVLEKRSRGWLKCLVLDPSESSSVAPFLRSLSTALSLRFPLHTAGDPFARPAHALALTSIVNALSLAAPTADPPVPLEARENDDARRLVGERVAVVLGVVKGLVPLLRSAAARPGAPTGVLVSLVPTASTHLALPFHALASAADAAISSLLHSLRRELTASTTSNVQLSILEVGFFHSSSSSSTSTAAGPATTPTPAPAPAPLPIRLDAVYAPALARRRPHAPLLSSSSSSSSSSGTAPAASPTSAQRKSMELRRLSTRVWKILVRPTHARAVERIGAGSRTYALVSILPHALVDLCLAVQDRLYGFYLSHVRRHALRLRRSTGRLAADEAATASRRPPLPRIPSALRPGARRDGRAGTAAPSHVGVGHRHAATAGGYEAATTTPTSTAPASTASGSRSSASGSSLADEEEEEPLLMSSDESEAGTGALLTPSSSSARGGEDGESPSMEGSFVHV